MLICDVSILHRNGKQALDVLLAPLGFSWREMVALLALSQAPDLGQSMLPGLLQTDKANVARLLQEMEGRDLITRTPAAQDSRRRDIHLTDAARTALPSLRDALTKWESHCLSWFCNVKSRWAL